MTNKIEDYIKLAEAATDGPYEIADDLLQNKNGHTVIAVQPDVDMVRGYNAWDRNSAFLRDSMTLGPALAKALLEAEQCIKEDVNALQDYIQTLEAHGHSLYYGHSVLSKSKECLATIQKLKEQA